jgi:hypothetical protein
MAILVATAGCLLLALVLYARITVLEHRTRGQRRSCGPAA